LSATKFVLGRVNKWDHLVNDNRIQGVLQWKEAPIDRLVKQLHVSLSTQSNQLPPYLVACA